MKTMEVFTMRKPILNDLVIKIVYSDSTEKAKIEWISYNEYYVYNDGGEGVAVAILDTNQITELVLTGDVEVSQNMRIVCRRKVGEGAADIHMRKKKNILLHEVEYWYTNRPKMEMVESDEEHVRYMINQ